ncbi:amino acid lyase [Prevotella sp. A2931]|uniref:Amino acid lyase n=1 Tax=Prevotella illustrans TaxID=2800387 RepID=A0ABS3M572_9BACT|nr:MULTISPECIES: aminotransferase class I/II-fold pyridoxal phosphate-dependent enzyme [Prevotella]MBO1363261.1 amino acid lyase [Prevotella illustrans]PTL26595.1 amino acid lyase [Prevotella sp. oral taxon 820]
MISFESDYNNGAHPKVLQHLVETNGEQTLSYGFDVYCDSAKEKIKAACDDPDAEIFFLAGGTQTNATVIDSILHTYEGVVSVETGHINTHEAGAIEFTEHKVISIKEKDGKMDAQTLDDYLYNFLHDGNASHSVYPGMVYITFPTEYGTLYSARELDEIFQVCRRYNLPLYVDGARLGYGLMADGNDITLPYLASHCDVFYIGGTKIGALCGEAIVFTHNNAHEHFFNIQKQHGALMAKGRLLGVQFDALFTDNLYFDISRHAIEMAMRMKRIFQAKGFRFFIDSPTNQQFVILSNETVKQLCKKDIVFTHWGPFDKQNMICRFVTSWATKAEELDYLEKNL